ncbi:MAG: hypothetical protein GYA21_02940 [Myxococcales bacterium]|nr:hypothetical protein [Myxococcales bacterium]
MKSVALLVCLGLTLTLAGRAGAEAVVYQYDQFDPDINVAAGQVTSIPLATQPGFASGEAFGQLYRPTAGQYPVKITGIDLILASPPNMPGTAEVNARIEVWAHSGSGAAPTGSQPLWSITTADLYNPNTGQFGMPLQGNTAMSITFDQSEPDNHPPDINSGSFLVMIRYLDDARDMQTEWGTMQCMYYPSLGACGCQEVGTLLDQATTQNANVLHVYGSSNCTGPATNWTFANAIGVTGDFILRVHAETGGCTPQCQGKECGPDGCGGSCGDCPGGETCDGSGQCVGCTPQCQGKQCGPDGCGNLCGTCQPTETCNANQQCVPATGEVSIGAISPDWGYTDSETPVSITGGGFKAGATVRLGGTNLSAVQILSASLISATVPSGMQPGKYMLIVMNSDGGTASLADAFEVRQRTCTPQCTGKECGPDGCGGSCGTCPANQTCDNAGQCIGCTPQCQGKQCGPDGCGGECGTCGAGEVCDSSGVCQEVGKSSGCNCATGEDGLGALLGLLLGLGILLWRRG